jgi:uncharacterized protein (TIRG00374 family)
MESVKYKVTWKTLLLPFIGLAAFFLYIYIFQVDLLAIIEKIQHINLYFYVLATASTLLDTLFVALAWHSLLDFLSVQVSRFRAFLYVWVGIFVDTLIPAESVSGEISKIYLVNREQNGTAGKATASIIAHRIIGMSINVGTLLVGAALLLIENQLRGMLLTLTLFLVVVTLFFLVLVLLLCVKENWTMRIVDGIMKFVERVSRGRWKLSRFREEALREAKEFHSAMKEYARAPKTMFTAVSLSVISWMFALAVFYLTFLSMGYPQISWSAILVITAIFMAVKSIPVGVPFEVGLPEITLTTLLYFFVRQWAGTDLFAWEISATATILMRLLTLWFRFFIGFAAQQWIGIKVITTEANGETNLNQTEKPKSGFSTDSDR